MYFLRFQTVLDANLLFRIHSGCIPARFGTQNALKSLEILKKLENLNVCASTNPSKKINFIEVCPEIIHDIWNERNKWKTIEKKVC